MSRQSTRVTRWLMGLPDQEPSSDLPDAPPPSTHDAHPALPPLPVRAPDAARPRVQGLHGSARDVRRRQVDDDPRHRATTPISPALQSLGDDLGPVLEDLSQRLEGLRSAVVATAEGQPVAHVGLSQDEAVTLADSTSRMCQGMGLPQDALDVAAVSLTSGDIVVVANAPHPQGSLLIRLTLQDTVMGLAILHAQRTATAVASA